MQQTHEVFGISISTILDWENLLEKTGSLEKRALNRSYKKIDPIALSEYILEFPDAYLHEIGKHFGCSATADSALFESWFENHFCPEIAGNIAVLDNATIHRKSKLFEIAKRHDITLIFLPPYSPDLNKIENFRAWIKNVLRNILPNFDNLMDAICCCFQFN